MGGAGDKHYDGDSHQSHGEKHPHEGGYQFYVKGSKCFYREGVCQISLGRIHCAVEVNTQVHVHHDKDSKNGKDIKDNRGDG